MKTCAHCKRQADNLKACSRCKQAFYCNTECQTFHWRNGHKEECGKIEAQHLKPKTLSKVCVNCGTVADKFYKCEKCRKMRYCSSKCQREHWQSEHKLTCRIMVGETTLEEIEEQRQQTIASRPLRPIHERIQVLQGLIRSINSTTSYQEIKSNLVQLVYSFELANLTDDEKRLCVNNIIQNHAFIQRAINDLSSDKANHERMFACGENIRCMLVHLTRCLDKFKFNFVELMLANAPNDEFLQNYFNEFSRIVVGFFTVAENIHISNDMKSYDGFCDLIDSFICFFKCILILEDENAVQRSIKFFTKSVNGKTICQILRELYSKIRDLLQNEKTRTDYAENLENHLRIFFYLLRVKNRDLYNLISPSLR